MSYILYKLIQHQSNISNFIKKELNSTKQVFGSVVARNSDEELTQHPGLRPMVQLLVVARGLQLQPLRHVLEVPQLEAQDDRATVPDLELLLVGIRARTARIALLVDRHHVHLSRDGC